MIFKRAVCGIDAISASNLYQVLVMEALRV